MQYTLRLEIKKTNKTKAAAAEFEQDERREIISRLLLYSFET